MIGYTKRNNLLPTGISVFDGVTLQLKLLDTKIKNKAKRILLRKSRLLGKNMYISERITCVGELFDAAKVTVRS